MAFAERRSKGREDSDHWRDRFDRRLKKVEHALEVDFPEFRRVQNDMHDDVIKAFGRKDSQFDAVCKMHSDDVRTRKSYRWLYGLGWGIAMSVIIINLIMTIRVWIRLF